MALNVLFPQLHCMRPMESKSRSKQANNKLVIGLTGGIGSGKSTVAQLFTELGIAVFDADRIAREVVAPGSPALAKIIEHFGQDIVDSAGLKRSQLRQIVFTDPTARKWLENLIHPLVRARMKALVQQAASPYCILMIPLLLENPRNELIQRVLVVDTPEELQLQRAQQRDNASSEQITRIMQAQVSRTQRLAKADDVIVNDGALAKLNKQVLDLHQQYLTLAAG